MEEVVNFIKSYGGESDKMVACGAIPILHYLTGRAPYITGCGGWIETDYVTAEEIKQQLISESKTKLLGQKEHYEAKMRQLEEEFLQKKETLAEKIFESIISS